MYSNANNTAQPTTSVYGHFPPSSFTGKERDEETGYGYFGARYMDYELTTMWLSVDPMSDKYPGISPYAYCAWNPVRLVDPDGEEMWKPELLEDGTVNYVAEKGDNANTLSNQYGLSSKQAQALVSTLRNGKISGKDVEKETGSEILRLNWNASYSTDRKTQKLLWNKKAVYQLGFAILYHRLRNTGNALYLDSFFKGMPSETGSNCAIPQWGTLGRSFDRTSGASFSIPALGGGDIPVSFADCTASSRTPLVFSSPIQVVSNGTYQLNMCVKSNKANYTPLPKIMINVLPQHETIFKNSYDI